MTTISEAPAPQGDASAPPPAARYDVAAIMGALYGDGILGLKALSAGSGRRSART